MTKVTDEMLMALADGELDRDTAASVQRSVDADPTLARRLAEFRMSRRFAKQAFAGVLEEAVPVRLVAAVGADRRRPDAGAQRSAMRMWLPIGAALAASVAGFVVAWMIFTGPQATSPLPLDAIASAMETTPSGQQMMPLGGNAGSLRITGSYPTGDGICRSFAAGSGGAGAMAWRGVACRHDERWTVELVVADHGGEDGGGFLPASDRATQAIDAFLDAAGAGERLDAASEDALRASGWRSGAE